MTGITPYNVAISMIGVFPGKGGADGGAFRYENQFYLGRH